MATEAAISIVSSAVSRAILACLPSNLLHNSQEILVLVSTRQREPHGETLLAVRGKLYTYFPSSSGQVVVGNITVYFEGKFCFLFPPFFVFSSLSKEYMFW